MYTNSTFITLLFQAVTKTMPESNVHRGDSELGGHQNHSFYHNVIFFILYHNFGVTCLFTITLWAMHASRMQFAYIIRCSPASWFWCYCMNLSLLSVSMLLQGNIVYFTLGLILMTVYYRFMVSWRQDQPTKAWNWLMKISAHLFSLELDLLAAKGMLQHGLEITFQPGSFFIWVSLWYFSW